MNAPLATVAKEDGTTFPPGLKNAFFFAGFNALSYQIVLMSPMILYARTLGASATVLGIVAGMMPLLVIFQIPAASYLHRIGYRKFVLAGWSTRISFIFLISLIPLLAFLDFQARLSLLLLCLFFFNLSRGISSCAWLPWITGLVPEAIRGKFLMREAAWVNCGSFITILFSAYCLGEDPAQWRFSILFAFSGTMGVASLVFLRRIPDVEIPDEIKTSKTRVPWREIAGYEPFRKLLRMFIAWAIASGGLNAFTVAFMKTAASIPEEKILLVTSMQFIGGLSSLWLLGSRLDHMGSRPVLMFSFAMFMLVLSGWFAMAGQLMNTSLALILVLQFLMGLGSALVGMAVTKLAMAIIPVMGRNHFFALYSVVGNLMLGFSPILWGLFLDSLKPLNAIALGIHWTRFTVFFIAAGLAFIASLILAKRLEEPQAASFETLVHDLLVQSPQRVWLRLWPRG